MLPVFRASEEDLDTVASDLQRLPNALAWPAAWPINAFARSAAQFMIDGLAKTFPGRVVLQPLPFVNSASELLASSLASPSGPVRQTARKVFDVMAEEFEGRHSEREATALPLNSRCRSSFNPLIFDF